MGEVYCLVEWENLNPGHGTPPQERRGNTLTKTPRTNLGRNALWSGWLGTTNDVSEHACGAYRVVSVDKWDDAPDGSPQWRVSLAPTDTPDED